METFGIKEREMWGRDACCRDNCSAVHRGGYVLLRARAFQINLMQAATAAKEETAAFS